ncbi:MAG: MerR family transcriptional regulator [Pyrinomonadaceae bacterium]
MGQQAVAIPEKIFFKIGEVCDIVGVQAHVLRYWETEFPQLSPQKNRSGQRSYRRRDVEIALRIKELLYEDMFTIAGAKKKLQTELRDASRLKIVHPEPNKNEPHLKAVKMPEPEDDDLDIEEYEPDFDEEKEVSATAEVSNKFENVTEYEFDDERREALKTLASQLLELREMLKTNRTAETEKQFQRRY